jgi:hypothetical protein
MGREVVDAYQSLVAPADRFRQLMEVEPLEVRSPKPIDRVVEVETVHEGNDAAHPGSR